MQLQNDDDYDKNYQPDDDEDGLVHCVGIKVHQGSSHCNNGTQPIQTGTYHSQGGRDDDVDHGVDVDVNVDVVDDYR